MSLDFLKSVINDTSSAKKRAAVEEIVPVQRKWMKRGEVAAIRDAAEAAEKLAKKERRTLNDAKNEADSIEAALAERKQRGADVPAPSSAEEKAVEIMEQVTKKTTGISAFEIKKLLRTYGQPITLFGETDHDRLERLKHFELNQHMKNTGSAGRRNLFQDIMEKEVEDELKAAAVAAMEKDKEKPEGEQTEEEKKDAKAKADKAELHRIKLARYAVDKGRDQFTNVEDYILHFFKRLMREWEIELENRPSAEKKTTRGKVASATQKQTRQYIRPFFKQLKARTLAQDIVRNMDGIVSGCRRKDYIKANEAYLTLAIGNAAWPMGVTQVGIHERAGREKIFSQHIAHALNDETQRKYIQSVKRLMTFCQHRDPYVPAKPVNQEPVLD